VHARNSEFLFNHQSGQIFNLTTSKGVAINFATANDVRLIKEIESYYNTQIDEMPSSISDYF